MRFLIDADLPRDTVGLLASYGHVAIDARDVGLRTAPDPDVARYAREHDLILVTADWGFGDVRVYPPGTSPGIVVLGLPDRATGREILRVLRTLLDDAQAVAKLPGRLAVVERGRIRFRPPV